MKALQLQSIGQLELVELPVPEIRPDELLIRTGATTICTSDVNDLRGNPFGIELPVVIGHEAAGTVAAVGAAVQGFQVGQRVATHPVHPCGNCPPCQAGLGHLCLHMGHFGVDLPGAMAEFYRVRQDRARPLPDDVPFDVAALAEPVCVCLEALEQAKLPVGGSLQARRLLIIGDGPFGVLMARLAMKMGLGRVTLAGQMDFRLSFAPAETRLNVKDCANPVEAMLSANGSAGYDAGIGYDAVGYDAVILAVGSRTAFANGLQCLKPRGRMVVFSALPGETPVDLFSLHLKELEIVGACSDKDLFDQAMPLLGDPSLALGELVTHHFPLEEYRQAFELAEFGKEQAMKVCFIFSDAEKR
jgi:threonine dehydrogenase-like Zn-dependent dehydrogenase